MKTVFRKIFILIAIILAFGLNLSYADNRSVDEIKNEIKILKNEFENSSNDIEKKEINKELSKLVDELLKRKWNVKNIYTKYSERSYDTCWTWSVNVNNTCTPWYFSLDTWDIIVVKSSHPDWWADEYKIWWWSHAFMIYDNKTIFEIKWPGYKSSKYSIKDLESRIKNWNYTEVALIRMGLNNYQKNDMKSYIDNNLINKWYFFPAPSSSWRYYCSSLIWKAHLNSWKKINLDDDWYIVYPIDLITSSKVGEVLHYYY